MNTNRNIRAKATPPATATPATAPANRILLTVPEAAERLGIAEKTTWSWIYKRRLPIVRLSGRCVRVPSDAIDRLIEESMVPAKASVQ